MRLTESGWSRWSKPFTADRKDGSGPLSRGRCRAGLYPLSRTKPAARPRQLLTTGCKEFAPGRYVEALNFGDQEECRPSSMAASASCGRRPAAMRRNGRTWGRGPHRAPPPSPSPRPGRNGCRRKSPAHPELALAVRGLIAAGKVNCEFLAPDRWKVKGKQRMNARSSHRESSNLRKRP